MKFSKKIAIAAVPAVMALASTNVDSKILLMSQEGWEVSFDGAANAFIMKNSGDTAPTTSGGAAFTASTYGGVSGANRRYKYCYRSTTKCLGYDFKSSNG